MTQRCGYIALVGRPNAGKSTLLNALVGDKIAVVSRKPQTTRNRILGVRSDGDTQLIFLDTPGVHRPRNQHSINTAMNRAALAAAIEGDVILFLVDITVGFTEQDFVVLQQVLSVTSAPVTILATKIDAEKYGEVAKQMRTLNGNIKSILETSPELNLAERLTSAEAVPVSAKRPESVTMLRQTLSAMLPESPWLFEEDDLTDMPRRFICAELIREQLFRQLGDEIPYGCAVRIEKIDMKPDITVVKATIIASRKTHKPIVVGKGGASIRAIGMAARLSLESHFDTKVFLDLSVQVSENWIDDERMVLELAHLAADGTPGTLQ